MFNELCMSHLFAFDKYVLKNQNYRSSLRFENRYIEAVIEI